MAGDGVSLQTNIAQLGNVAKAQARGQQANPLAPVQTPEQKQQIQSLQRIREGEKTDPERLDPEQQRRHRRGRDDDEAAAARPGGDENDDDSPDDGEPWIGGLVDTKA